MKEEKQEEIQTVLNSFLIDKEGRVEFKGEITEKNFPVVQSILHQAEYYKSKSVELEKQTRKASADYDTIIIVFVGCILSLAMFGGYALTSILMQRHQLNQPTRGQINGDVFFG